ncbi:MAG TPA: carboxypeptidase-like regulatory domain-containing protein [Bryobacteraceae bacterium]
MRIRLFGALLSACLALTLMQGALFAQATDGNIVGSALDATGAGVPGASVEAANVATGVKTNTKTDASGAYRLNNLLVGIYNVTVSATGFTTASVKQVEVELNKITTLNITLAVGSLTTAVEVSESGVHIDTTTAQVSNTYTSQMAAEIPAAANPFSGVLNLSLLGAGVASAGGFGTASGPSVGGQRPRNNNYTVEGVDNNRKDVTGPVVSIPGDAVAEFSVLQNQFSAEFGHSSGGQFNTIIRGGTNDIHGVVYEYLLNRDLNAIDQAAKRQGTFSNPRYDQSHLGAGIGGPIIKNKLFYYGLFEYNPLGQASVPSSAVYAPTAAGYATLATLPGVSATNLGILKQYAPPTTTQVKTTAVNGVAIPLGVLPIVAPNFANVYTWLVSVDYNRSDKDQFRIRYVDNKTSQIDTNNVALPVFFYPRPTTEHLASVSHFHNFGPSLTNELRLAFNRYNDNIGVPNFQFPGLDVFPNIQMATDLNLQIGPDANGPQATIQTTEQLVENLSWIKGRHEFKFGGDVRILKAASTFIQMVRGDYQYSSLSRFLLDQVPDVLAERNVGGKPYSGDDYGLYFYGNDNWKVNRNLTVNLGLRYEFNSVAQSMKEFALNAVASVPGVITFAAPQPQKKNFAPRVGFAYTPGTSANTSIRGGFGIAYDQIFDNVGTNARPPQATSTVDSTVSDATGYLAHGGILPTATAPNPSVADLRAATSSYLGNQQYGYSINWNLGIQHVFHNDYTLEVRYLGNRGAHLLFQEQLNRNSIVTATHNLPTYLQAPSQATLDSLPLTLAGLTAEKNSAVGNPFLPYGFTSTITAYLPRGNSSYNGVAVEMTKRFSAHLLFKAAYTWSHLLDDSTAEVNSTALTPRRPQDFNDFRSEWASSLLDRRHRLTYTWLYQAPWFQKDTNWFKRNLLGNIQFAGTYTYEAPEFGTPQSATDSNLNGDAAADRVIINTSGTPGLSSDVTALKNTKGDTVAYLANNPNAQYIRALPGAFATSGRNILRTQPINNFDFNFVKSFALRERTKLEFRADFFNGFNHPQYTPGRVNNVTFLNRAGVTNYLTPGNAVFGQFDQVYSSNPRNVQLAAKVTF